MAPNWLKLDKFENSKNLFTVHFGLLSVNFPEKISYKLTGVFHFRLIWNLNQLGVTSAMPARHPCCRWLSRRQTFPRFITGSESHHVIMFYCRSGVWQKPLYSGGESGSDISDMSDINWVNTGDLGSAVRGGQNVGQTQIFLPLITTYCLLTSKFGQIEPKCDKSETI